MVYVVMTQRHQPTTINAVQTMNKLMVWFQRQAGLADGAAHFCVGYRKN
jgi:hypothetical protein